MKNVGTKLKRNIDFEQIIYYSVITFLSKLVIQVTLWVSEKRKMNQRKRKTVVKGSRHENHACAHDHFNDFIFTSIIGKENYRITKSLESLHIMMTPDQ